MRIGKYRKIFITLEEDNIMTKKRRIALIISALILTITLTGCMPPDTDTPSASTSPGNTPQQSAIQLPTTRPTETPAETPTAAPTDTPATQVPGEMHAEGEYVGRIDNNSIEVIVNGIPAAYRLTEMTIMQMLALTEGQTIGFTYEQNDVGQNVIVRFDDTPQTLTAVFAGQIDPHSIEATTNDGDSVVFQLTGDALTQAAGLKPGDTIVITFTMNDVGQNVASSLAVQ